jgi:hypothetical protein
MLLGPNPSHCEQTAMPVRRVALPLPHHLDVNGATHYMVGQLDCDRWHVACRHDHQLVVQLTRGGRARYCVAYNCSPSVERGIYHGSRAWAMVITPLHGKDNLTAQREMEIKAGLHQLHA